MSRIRRRQIRGKRTDLTSSTSVEEVIGGTDRKLGKMAGTSHTTVQRARKVLDSGVPALVKAVESGKIAVIEAAQEID